MIETSAQLFSTSSSSTKKIQYNPKSKIIGYNFQIDQSLSELVPLKSVLPIKKKVLDFLLTNLVQILLEILQRKLEIPFISLDSIMVNQSDISSGIPYVFTKQDKEFTHLSEKSLFQQFSLICEQLGYDQYFLDSNSLKEFQSKLILNLDLQNGDNCLEYNCQILFENLQIELNIPNAKNKLTSLYVQSPPKFLFLNEQNISEIAIKVQKIVNEEFYQLREIEIIEEFNNKHLPYLYGYLRYYDILVLFLKKHDMTFSQIIQQLHKKRKNIDSEQIKQCFYKLNRDMINAIQYTHCIDIIHRDIKPENIMFDISSPVTEIIEILQTEINCVLIDFDRSIAIEDMPQQKSNYQGTLFYMPPEGIQSQYRPSYDVWQLGYMWLVIQKTFYYEQKNTYEKIKQWLANVRQINNDIRELEKNQYENKFIGQQLSDKLSQLKNEYAALINFIKQQENFFTYDNTFQEIIDKMIALDPQERVNLKIVQQVLDSIIKLPQNQNLQDF